MLAPSPSVALATILTIVVPAASSSLAADCAAGPALCDTSAGPMMKNSDGVSIDPVFTVGESIKGYRPPGVLDGIAAFKRNDKQVRLLVNHELHKDQGYIYQLANGVELTGARVSYFDIHRSSRKLSDAGPAYTRAYDRYGNPVSAAGQVNESGSATDGFDRLCSSSGYVAGKFGFVDTIYFTHEEANEREGHPHGGTVWAIDVDGKAIWALPALGRGAWENVTALRPPHAGTIALALGDDYGNASALSDSPEVLGAPLYVFIGSKDTSSAANFPARNGLSAGQLYFFKSAESCAASPLVTSPLDFNGTGASMTGVFCPIAVRDTAKAGSRGYDDAGYLNAETLRATALGAGAFAFSRPEDLHVNPSRASEFVFASTGRGRNFSTDDWGDVYIVSTNLRALTANIRILYDGDDQNGGPDDQFAHPDYGLRSPDNVVWGHDGLVYVNEDPATQLNEFGSLSGRDASIWQLSPRTGTANRIAEMDRTALYPPDAANDPDEFWESSGILDVTELFPTRPGETLLVSDVQAHGITGGAIGGRSDLVEGGQLFFLLQHGR